MKHGCKEATIEIEVQGKPSDKINPVIKRIISENNNTKYFINSLFPSPRFIVCSAHVLLQMDKLPTKISRF